MIEYLAGIFDSEGYVRIRKTNGNCYTPEVRIYMTNKSIVHEFAKLYDLEIKSANRGIGKKLCYYVTLGVKVLRKTTFLIDFLPFLNEKKLQLQEVYNLLFTIKDNENCYIDYMKYKETFDHELSYNPSIEYLAGIIDGDGWFTMFKSSKTPSILNKFAIGLEQRYKPLINYMLILGGNVRNRTIRDSINHKQTYEWKTYNRDILNFLISIEPFLIEKRKNCNILIQYIKNCNEFETNNNKLLLEFRLDK